MLHRPFGADPNMSQEGLHFASVAAITDVDAVTTLDSYFINAQNRQPIVGYGYGEAVNYRVLEDMPGITEVASIIYIGLVRNHMHWLNTDDGLPLHFTEAVYQLVKKYNFEENVPMHTPAMGVPRTARQSSTTEIAKLLPLTQSFRIEGEVYARRFDSIQVIASLAAAANGINSSNARNAYSAILFGKSVSPLTPPSSNTDSELMFRAMEEAALLAIFHKRKDAFSYLAQRARVVMQTSPSKTTPTVAIIPFGKMSAISSIANNTEYWLAGAIGPKRVKNGQPSDVDTGRVIDGDGSVLKLSGVEIREAPMVTNFDTSVDQMSRRVFLGGIEIFSPPSMATFGGDHTSGKSYGNGLPWCKRYSAEKDSHTKISFETLVERCGWFKKVPGLGDNGGHNDDFTKHLWVLDTDLCQGIADPANFFPVADANADPFFYHGVPAGGGPAGVQVRDRWMRTREDYTDDVKVFWKYVHVSDEQMRIASTENAPAEQFDENNPGNWPFTKWTVEKALRINSRYRLWNYNIATMNVAAVTDAINTNNLATIIDLIADGTVGPIPGFLFDPADPDYVGQAQARLDALRNFTFSPDRMAMMQGGGVPGMTLAELAEEVDFLLKSPMQEYYMQDVAFIRSGAELGKTFMSHPTINVGHDVTINDWKWVIQYRSAAVVTNPDLVTVFRNVLYDGMGAGNNSEVMTIEEARALKDNNYELREGAASIIAVPIPKITKPTGVSGLDNVDPSRTIFALSGTIPLGNREGGVRAHYPGYKLCSELFGWNRARVLAPTGGNSLPLAPLLFRGSLTWPTSSGEIVEESHDHHGLGAVGARDVRMYGRSLNPTAIG